MSCFFVGPNAIERWIEESVVQSLQTTTSNGHGHNSNTTNNTNKHPTLHQTTVLAQIIDVESSNNHRHHNMYQVSDGKHSICALLSSQAEQAFQQEIARGSVKGCAVKISHWKVCTQSQAMKLVNEEQPQQQQQQQESSATNHNTDSLCLFVSGSMSVLNGQEMGVSPAGSPENVHSSVLVKQWIQFYQFDWEKIAQQLLPRRNKTPVAAAGSLSDKLENPLFLQHVKMDHNKLKEAFLAKKPSATFGNQTGNHTGSRSSSTPVASRKRSRPSSDANNHLFENVQVHPTPDSTRDDDEVMEEEEEEEDMDIAAMLVSQKAMEENIEEDIQNLETQPREEPLPPSTLSPSQTTDSQLPTPLDTQPIPVEEANDKLIRAAYKQAEHTSPGVIHPRLSIRAPSPTLMINAPLLLQPSPVSTPPKDGEDVTTPVAVEPRLNDHVTTRKKRNKKSRANDSAKFEHTGDSHAANYTENGESNTRNKLEWTNHPDSLIETMLQQAQVPPSSLETPSTNNTTTPEHMKWFGDSLLSCFPNQADP